MLLFVIINAAVVVIIIFVASFRRHHGISCCAGGAVTVAPPEEAGSIGSRTTPEFPIAGRAAACAEGDEAAAGDVDRAARGKPEMFCLRHADGAPGRAHQARELVNSKGKGLFQASTDSTAYEPPGDLAARGGAPVVPPTHASIGAAMQQVQSGGTGDG